MKLSYSKPFLKKLGDKLRTAKLLTKEDEDCFNEFRLGHINILTYYIDSLANITNSEKFKDKEIFIGARLKKRDTIINKLQIRLKEMSLYRMHDIAGVRLIFPDIETLLNFKNDIIAMEKSNKKYCQLNVDKYDYIHTPKKETGYRGFHLIFQETEGEIKANIEIQLRTEVQHAWATTLEMWDSEFRDNAKFGLANKETTRFFFLISEFLARFIEDKKINSTDLSDKDLYTEIISLEKKLQILQKLKTISSIRTTKGLRKDPVPTILIKTTLNNKRDIEIIKYKSRNLKNAIYSYSKKELENNGKDDIVLIFSKNMKKAYNNYFNDLSMFFEFYNQSINYFSKKYPVFYLLHK